jgi:hypothetical protein
MRTTANLRGGKNRRGSIALLFFWKIIAYASFSVNVHIFRRKSKKNTKIKLDFWVLLCYYSSVAKDSRLRKQ